MACCKCNRSGSCNGCACVKANEFCDNCLPGKLGNCSNRPPATTSASNPPPEYASMSTPTFTWGKLSGPAFTSSLDAIYTKVGSLEAQLLHSTIWQGRKGLCEGVIKAILGLESTSALESVALKAALILPILFLLKPSRCSKTKHPHHSS